MHLLHTMLRLIDNINEWVGRIFSLGVLLMFALVLSEVIRRYLFNSPTVWGNELTQLTFGAYTVLAGGYVLKWGGHVNVDIFYIRLSTRGRAVVDIITFALFFIFGAMMLVYGGSLAWDSLSRLEHSQSAWNPPLYPVKLMIPTGAFLLLIQGIAKLVRDIITVATGEKIAVPTKEKRETI